MFTQIHFTTNLQLKSLYFILGLQHLDGASLHRMWNNYDKLLVIFEKPSVSILSYLHEVSKEY